jgi:uncharacterized protein (TIGR02996 family)
MTTLARDPRLLAARRAFLAAVVGLSDDDLPRRVFADWLADVAGDDRRAEFIRVQCDLAGASRLSVNEHGPLILREHALLTRWHRRRWTGLPQHACGITNWLYRRGLIHAITIECRHWDQYHATILARCPIQHARDGLVVFESEPYLSKRRLKARWPGVHFKILGHLP